MKVSCNTGFHEESRQLLKPEKVTVYSSDVPNVAKTCVGNSRRTYNIYWNEMEEET